MLLSSLQEPEVPTYVHYRILSLPAWALQEPNAVPWVTTSFMIILVDHESRKVLAVSSGCLHLVYQC